MRIVVLLKPTNKRGTKGAYTRCRKLLAREGFITLQPEVFMRVVTRRRAVRSHLEVLRAQAPQTGCIRVLTLTEGQFGKIQYLAGGPDAQELLVGACSFVGFAETPAGCIGTVKHQGFCSSI